MNVLRMCFVFWLWFWMFGTLFSGTIDLATFLVAGISMVTEIVD